MSYRTCIARGCEEIMKSHGRLACNRHWYALPKKIRQAITDAQRARWRSGSDAEERDAARSAELEAVEIAKAELERRQRGAQLVEICRGCGADIVFLATRRGKRMPVDADTVGDEETEYQYGVHEPHFASCRKADEFRRRRG